MKCKDPKLCKIKHNRWKRNQNKFIPVGEKEHERYLQNYSKNKAETIFSTHYKIRSYQRSINSADLTDILKYGWVIERTRMGYLQEVYLTVLGYTKRKRPFHVVFGVNSDHIWTVITAYTPRNDVSKWSEDYQERVCFCNKDEWMTWV